MIAKQFGMFEPPDLAPFVLCERSTGGWRGLTEEGELYNVEARDGHIPERLCISNGNGMPLGYRALPRQLSNGQIERYLTHFDRARHFMFADKQRAALVEINLALDVATTTRAHFNRAMILLGLGRWREGLDAYERCERTPSFARPIQQQAIACGIEPWRGEDIAGKHLLLTHDHGFGDTIMMLRYVPRLKAMGAEVTILAPPVLKRLAEQVAPVTDELIEADYFCSFLLLLHALLITPDNIPLAPYLDPDPGLVEKWRTWLPAGRRRIGVAWNVGVIHEGDYPRTIPLDMLVEKFRDADLYSVQVQNRDEAEALGVTAFEFEDFAECAALMWLLDEIVTVDTAALHLAGAIGRPPVTALLSHWASWRWISPWYQNIRFCRQQMPGDWASALAQYEEAS
jgi:hypothetical protein